MTPAQHIKPGLVLAEGLSEAEPQCKPGSRALNKVNIWVIARDEFVFDDVDPSIWLQVKNLQELYSTLSIP